MLILFLYLLKLRYLQFLEKKLFFKMHQIIKQNIKIKINLIDFIFVIGDIYHF